MVKIADEWGGKHRAAAVEPAHRAACHGLHRIRIPAGQRQPGATLLQPVEIFEQKLFQPADFLFHRLFDGIGKDGFDFT